MRGVRRRLPSDSRLACPSIGALLGGVAGGVQARGELFPAFKILGGMFVGRLGHCGRCDCVYAFLQDVTREVATNGFARPSSLAPEPIRHSARRAAPHTALIQIGKDGDNLIAVVNQVLAGGAWLSARHGVGAAKSHETLRAQLS